MKWVKIKDGIVVNIIVPPEDAEEMKAYREAIMVNIDEIVEVENSAYLDIGFSYADGAFTPPAIVEESEPTNN